MNLKNKPYSIFGHDLKGENKALWFRVRSFSTMANALNSLQGLTKTPKHNRSIVYTILPNNNEQKKYILIKEELQEEMIKAAR